MPRTPRSNVPFALILALALVVSLAATLAVSPPGNRASPLDVATRGDPVVVRWCGSLCWRDTVAQDSVARDTGPISG
jgi:hypothetical protein